MLLLLQKDDSGLYECQINTEPLTSHYVSLQVLGGDNEREASGPQDDSADEEEANPIHDIYVHFFCVVINFILT